MKMVREFVVDLSEVATERVSYDLEAALLFALSENKRQIYGFVYTPYGEEELLPFLRASGESFHEYPDYYVGFTVTSPETVAGLLRLVSWTDDVTFILDPKPFSELGRPRLQYRLYIFEDPLGWFKDRAVEWEILCFAGTVSIVRGLDIRSTCISFYQLYTLIAPVLRRYGLEIPRAQLDVVQTV